MRPLLGWSAKQAREDIDRTLGILKDKFGIDLSPRPPARPKPLRRGEGPSG